MIFSWRSADVSFEGRHTDECTPQKHHPTSPKNFFQPVFLVLPAEKIFDLQVGF
jgi:hypothetical protein